MPYSYRRLLEVHTRLLADHTNQLERIDKKQDAQQLIARNFDKGGIN